MLTRLFIPENIFKKIGAYSSVIEHPSPIKTEQSAVELD